MLRRFHEIKSVATPPDVEEIKMKSLKVLSLFDGISCGMVALERAGFVIEKYVAYEVDVNAILVSNANYPQIEQCGDVFKGDFTQYQGFDLLIGGSPCTYWSISKKEREITCDGIGFKLFMEYKRALDESGCNYFLYENNYRIHKDIQNKITEILGVHPILINSSLVSAQSRNRLYWTNIPNVTCPADKGISMIDILTDDCLSPYNGAAFNQLKEQPNQKYHSTYKIGHTGKKDKQSTRVYSIYGKSQTISAEAGGGGAKTGLYLWRDNKIYSLNVKAVELLQTLPLGYLSNLSKDKAIKAAGNGWTVDVIAHILNHMVGDKL